MSNPDVTERVVKVVKKYFVNDDLIDDNFELTEKTNLAKDLGADSLDVVEITMDVEDEFNIHISLDEFQTVGDIVKAVEKIIS